MFELSYGPRLRANWYQQKISVVQKNIGSDAQRAW